MHTLFWCIYYDPAGKNVGLEMRRLELTLLASTFIQLQNVHEIFPSTIIKFFTRFLINIFFLKYILRIKDQISIEND